MLDLAKLAGQLPPIGKHLQLEAKANRQRLELAQGLLAAAATHQPRLTTAQQQWRDRFLFAAASPLEPLEARYDLSAPPEQHTVFATDGSQISPSHHEIAYCYLLNIGRIALHYGQGRHPLLDSLPEVFYKPEDLYISRQWGIRTEEWMGYRRTISEAEVLADLASQWAASERVTDLPILAMVDGSLIYWFLESLPGEARDRLLPPILTAWERLRTAGVPLLGYLSASRSSEATNFLRLEACPFDAPNCAAHCGDRSDRLPCQVIDPLRDTVLWASQLEPGQRGPLWSSSAKILDLYGEPLRIYFCYVHVGSEVARIEVPAWVAADPARLNEALSIMLGQVYKGYGYPVALAEAHNQAVVRGGDRARFFSLLEQQMIRAGLRNVGTSYKETRKRGSIA